MISQVSILNNKLDCLLDWLTINKLSLNINKTKFMLFHFLQTKLDNSVIPKIKFKDKLIERVDHFKFLGIYIDSCLTWDKHVFEICNKISKTVGILSVLKHKFPIRILLMIYNSLILSHINYGVTLWGFNNCNRLKQLQKKAIRYITNSSFFAHTKPLCKTLNCLLFDDIFDLACAKFYFKFKNGLLPMYFYENKFIEAYECRRNLTRKIIRPPEFTTYITDSVNFRPLLLIPSFKNNHCRKVLRFRIAYLFNNKIPSCVTDKVYSLSLLSFCKCFKKHILDNYEMVCYNFNCFVCLHGNA